MAIDAELMRRVETGDATAFDELFERHSPAVRRRLMSMLRDASLADDLMQEVFLRLWQRAEQWDGRGSVGGWLNRAATNLALNHIRSRRRNDQRIADWSNTPPRNVEPPDEQAEHAEQFEKLRSLIEALPAAKREAMELVHGRELNIADAADALGVPPGTIKSRLHHARQDLLREMRAHEDETETP